MDHSQFILQLVVSMICGMVIGLERQWRQHPAGIRSNALICVGATLFCSLSLLEKDTSATRVVGQVVTGIGFLGAGVVLRDGLSIKGITSAATIWCCAAIGSLAGTGYLLYTIIGTVAVLFLNYCCHPLSKWVDAHARHKCKGDVNYRLRLGLPAASEQRTKLILTQYCDAHHKLALRALARRDGEQPGTVLILADIHAPEPSDDAMEELITRLQMDNVVNDLHWERQRAEPE
jgi:putative Mg2+ transporter-C (MgtC) family protein